MHHLLLVYFFESANQLSEYYPGLKLSEPPSTQILQVFDIASIAKFHDQVESVLSALYVVEADDILIVDFRQDVDLIFEVVEQSRCQTLLFYDLHSKVLFVVIFHVAPVHRAELSLS
jgi:hypothetical protein